MVTSRSTHVSQACDLEFNNPARWAGSGRNWQFRYKGISNITFATTDSLTLF